jgi:RHS repeat-associated protein
VDRRFHAIVTDLTGTPTELVTATGEVVWQRRTALWGATTDLTRTGVDCPIRFPGQYHDPETGIHYNCRRYYEPTTAGYLSADPLGLAPAPNPHAYVPSDVEEWYGPMLAPR